MRRFAQALAPLLSQVPPRLGTTDWKDLSALLRLGWRIRRLGDRDMRELLRIGGMNVHDLLEEHFEHPLLKGALAFDAVLGTNFGPRSPGTVLTLLYRLAAEAAGGGALSQPKGGVGGLCAALARAASAAGCRCAPDAPVGAFWWMPTARPACELESGERIAAPTVVSSADPKTTFLQLLGAPSPRYRLRAPREASALARPGREAASGARPAAAVRRRSQAEALRGRLLLAPSLEYLERAFNHAKYGEYSSARRRWRSRCPTLNDASARAGRQARAVGRRAVRALCAQGRLAAGAPRASPTLCIDASERFAPGLASSVVGAELLTPLDIEREFRISGGHWHHGELAFDQFFMVRPVPGAAQHRTPLAGLIPVRRGLPSRRRASWASPAATPRSRSSKAA